MLRPLIEAYTVLPLKQKNKLYLRLCSSIISQQLNVKVAALIYQRFLDLYGGREPSLARIASTSQEALRNAGLSRPKASYIHNVCSFFLENKITDAQLHRLSNEEVIRLLTQIKGIGRWTVEMLLIFSMKREDVFALDDLGLRQAIERLYKPEAADVKSFLSQMEAIASAWSPYRSYASLYLWKYAGDKSAAVS